MHTLKSRKGAVLITSFAIISAVSIILSAYVIWVIYSQKALERRQKIEQLMVCARSGLNRAVADLYADTGSWLDGDINGIAVTKPDASNPNAYYQLYSPVPHLDDALGSVYCYYDVSVRYLRNPAATSEPFFFEKRMWIRSVGKSADNKTSYTLDQLVEYGYGGASVANITQVPKKYYSSLNAAINDLVSNGWNDNTIAITEAILVENPSTVAINSNRFKIRGCYDPNFNFRSCSNYPSVVKGSIYVGASADVSISGITIQSP